MQRKPPRQCRLLELDHATWAILPLIYPARFFTAVVGNGSCCVNLAAATLCVDRTASHPGSGAVRLAHPFYPSNEPSICKLRGRAGVPVLWHRAQTVERAVKTVGS